MSEITVTDNRIEVVSTSQLKQALYEIGNGRLLGSYNKFIFPKTPMTAHKLFQATVDTGTMEWSPEFRGLLAKYQTILDVQVWKTKDSKEQPKHRTMDTLPAYQHQLNAYRFGKDLRSVMFWMGVGTGKSKLSIEIARNNEAKRIIIVCPSYIHRDDETWTKQLRQWFEGEYEFLRLLKGSVTKKAEEAKKFLSKRGQVTKIIGINYESFWRPAMAEFLLSEKFDTLIIDESHKVKSHNSEVAEFTAKVARNFEQIIALTGTVMYANPLDVYGQYRILDSAIFGTSFTKFRARYADIYDHNGIPIVRGYINQNELVEKIAPITFQVDEAVLNLPEPIHDVRTFELSPDERKVYKSMEEEAALDLGEDKGYTIATHILTKLMRLRQITGGFIPLDDWETDETRLTQIGDSKKQLFKSILDDLPKDEPIVVFSHFVADLKSIEEAAKELKRNYGEISGRRYDKNRWNAGEIDVLGVIDSAGEGMDFTRASYGCFYSYDYSIGKFKQCVGRIRRPPNTRFAYFYHLTAKGTIDEEMYKGIKEGENLLHKAIDYLRSLR